MSNAPSEPNPFAPSSSLPGVSSEAFGLPADKLKKVEAVIKDAGQFWLAILICFLCTGIGLLLIGPWYLIRLLQWNSLAKEFPVLTQPNSPLGSLPMRFQSSRWKLIAGLIFAMAILLLLVMYVVLVVSLSAGTP